MKERRVQMLGEEDEEIVDLLVELGLPRITARATVYLAQVDEATSREIEIGAGLRQPEVSTATIDLRSRGWASIRQEKLDRGRPSNVYKLTKSLSEVADHLASKKTKDLDQHLTHAPKLREMVETI